MRTSGVAAFGQMNEDRLLSDDWPVSTISMMVCNMERAINSSQKDERRWLKVGKEQTFFLSLTRKKECSTIKAWEVLTENKRDEQ